jgi:hypothetical protein
MFWMQKQSLGFFLQTWCGVSQDDGTAVTNGFS